jgi:hypothetical protein
VWIYHFIRLSVAPEHATAWIALQTIATALALVVAGIYARLTYLLWKEANRTSQSALMQQMMVEYDSMRRDVKTVRDLLYQRHATKEEAVGVFRTAVHFGALKDVMGQVDDSRFHLSRFFVKARKLSQAGYLDRNVIAMALQRAAIEDVFLGMIDPLDQVLNVKARGKISVADRDFYTALLLDLPELL